MNSIKKLILPFLFIIFSFQIPGIAQQKFYIPRNIMNAYENGTRSMDGSPGPNYWQNTSDYNIQVKVNPKTKLVSGSESIKYFNNSPDTLKFIVFRLYQNIDKKGAARDFQLDTNSITNGEVIERLAVDNKEIDLDSSRQILTRGTNMYLRLTDPLLPHSKINFSIDWNFNIPEGSNPRMGMYDSTSFLIGYWYPQVSVYDDIDGWDTYDYTGIQEFYNDFSNFDVSITVPNSFAVWATGILQNPAEVLQTEYLNKYNEAYLSDSVIHIITASDLKKGNIFNSNKEENTWHYKADHVTDFVFGTSDHYLWDAVGLTVDKSTGRRTYIAAAYKESSKDFYGVDSIARKSIEYYSNILPGVPFPYPSLTVFNGRSGGMEFPMMVNDGSFKDNAATVHVTSHEICHEYFPFYMGTNERKYAWMDEGMATFIPFDLQSELAPGYDPRARIAAVFSKFAGDETEMPMIIPSELLRYDAYRTASYIRPGLAYDFLRNAIGKDKFDKAFRGYINIWHGKHPCPYDFFNIFNTLTGEDLNWFWKPWFIERGYPDLGINSAQNDGNKVVVVVDKIGSLPVPVDLKIISEDGKEIRILKNASIWQSGNHEITIEKELDSPATKIELGNTDIPDVNNANNVFTIK